MTVSYSKHAATASFGCFLRLLLRWRGSIYKFVWQEFLLFAGLYFLISIIYRFALDAHGKRVFEQIAALCEKNGNMLPVAFILGFYVSVVVSRFWQQLNSLPWPHRLAFFVGGMIHRRDEQGRMLRRTIMRYLTVAYILTMKDICPPVRKRFPTLQRMRDVALITEEEQKLLTELSRINRTDRIDSAAFLGKNLVTLNEDVKGDKQTAHQEVCPNVYYVPLLWAVDLVNQAFDDNRIKDHTTRRILIEEINNYRGQCAGLFIFDWITIPLVYTQVVTISVFTFFLSCLFGRQYLEGADGDFYVPVFTFLQYIFYMGWLEVAHALLNPFGGDDDDFEINPLIEDNLQVAFNMADELCDLSPPLDKDTFFDAVDVDIAYTASSAEYRDRRYQGSAVKSTEFDCWGLCKRKKKEEEEEDKTVITKKTEETTEGAAPAVVDVEAPSPDKKDRKAGVDDAPQA